MTHHKYVSSKKSYYQIRGESGRLCKEHGLSVVTSGKERCTCSKTLGEAYTVEAITERIAGTYRAKPKALRQEKAGVSMLIDIQNSIKAAESRGYEQWAKIHNLKQAAKTLNFLTEHDISEYEQLQAVLDEVHTESENTTATLKGLEKRLSDISLLMKNISAYQQTKGGLYTV